MTQKLKVIQGGKTNPFASWKDLLVLQEALRNAGHEAARVAVARGEGKKLKDKGGLDKPLTQDEINAWSKEMEQDSNKHFTLLPKACVPQLVVLDIDDPESAHGKKLVETCQAASVLTAKSQSRGHHFYLVRDAGARDLFPNNAYSAVLKSNRADAAHVGDALAYQATAYVPVEGEVLGICDVPNLYQLLTGNAVSPNDKLVGMLKDISDKVAGWGEGVRDPSMFRLVKSMPRRLREQGLEDRQDEVAKHLADCFALIDPDDKAKYDKSRVLALMEEAEQDLGPVTQSADGTAGAHSLAYSLVMAAHKNNIVIDASNPKDPAVHAWDPFMNEWKTTHHTTKDDGTPLVNEIGEAVVSSLYDTSGKSPTLAQKQMGKTVVWNELVDNCSVGLIKKHFDYPGEAEVVYLGIGKGKVVRISSKLEHKDEPVKVVSNKPEYKVAAHMTAPAEEESELFIEKMNEIWPEEGVTQWHIAVWAEALCPFQVRRPDFVSWVGTGGNGKSLIMDAICHALGDYATKVKSEVLVKPKNGTPEIRQLGGRTQMIGKRLIFVDETPRGITLDEGFVKAAVAGGELSTGGMRQDDMMYRLDGKMFVASNHRIRLLDAGNSASTRRMKEVQFSQTIDDGNGKNGDTTLPARLRKEAGGIIRMLLNAVTRRIQLFHESNDPVAVPASIKAATLDWFGQQNFIQDQLKAFLVPDDKAMEVMRGRREGTGDRYTGIAALAALLVAGEASDRKNPVHEANHFTTGVAFSKCAGRPTYRLRVTEACMRWLAEVDLELTEKERIFWSLFKQKDRARTLHQDRLSEVFRQVDMENRDEGPVFDKGGDFADL